MNEALALKYRPRSFSDTVGQKPVRAVLRQMVVQDRLPPALLFAGPRGTGKTTTGRILASALNCTERSAEHPDPCGACPSCKAIFLGNSTDVIEVDAASSGLVDDIRKIREAVMYSVGGKYRVVLLDEAHSMSKEAFNALLKTLEEPPPQTVFVLLTTEPSRILETVLSRCMLFEFRRVSPGEIAGRLRHICESEHINLDVSLIELLADRSQGGLRDAVMSLDQCSRVGVSTCEQFAKLVGEEDFAPAIVEALVDGDIAQSFFLLEEVMQRTGDPQSVSTQLVRLFRDLLILSTGAVTHYQGQQLEVRKQLLAKTSVDRVFSASRVLWELKTRIRVTEDGRSMLELAFVLLLDAFGHGAIRQLQSPEQPSPVLNLAALKDLAAR